MSCKRLLKALVMSLFLVAIVTVVHGQQQYMVGSSKISIDPDSTVFSLPLAGYGAPREGRFDLQWQYQEALKGMQYMATAGNRLYAVNTSGELLEATVVQPEISWKKIAEAKNIKSITGGAASLYAVTAGNDVVVFDLLKKKGWKKAGTAANVTAITLFQGKLYAVTTANQLLQGTIGKSAISWKQVGEANHFTLLANDGVKIYGVDEDNTLWFIKPAHQMVWLKIGVNNESTYTTPIKQLLVYKKRLFALSADDKFVVAIHTTDHTLFARSLAIKNKNTTVVIVTVDLTGFDYSLGKEVKEIIYKKRRIPPSAILINGSHTHFAPVSQWFPTFGEHGQIPDSIWFNNILKKGIVRSIEAALDHLAPETIYFGRGSTHIGHNRSSPDGKTPNDTTMDVLKFVNTVNKTNEIVFNAGCHPVFRNEGKEGVTVSANYPGVTRNVLEEKTGASTTLFMEGCAGDINPVSGDHVKTGTELASDVLDVLNRNMHPLDGSISYTMDSILIPTHPWSKEKIMEYKTDNLKEPGDVGAEKNVRWSNMMLNYYAHNAVPKTMPVYVQTITIGDWKLVGLSREVVTEYGPAIRAIWPDNYVTVAGYCNDIPSYLPVGRHIKAETYEGVDSFFWNAQPSLFPVDIFDRVIEAIRKIKNK